MLAAETYNGVSNIEIRAEITLQKANLSETHFDEKQELKSCIDT